MRESGVRSQTFVIAQPKYVYSIREDLFFNSFKVATQYNSFEFYA
jgi:hypothetical protein